MSHAGRAHYIAVKRIQWGQAALIFSQSVLDTSIQHDLRVAGELALRPDEDNVTTIAFGQAEGTITTLYAGINSAPADVEKGENQHLRTFSIEEPLSPSASSTTSSSGSSAATNATLSSTTTPRCKTSTGAVALASVAIDSISSLRPPKVVEVARTRLFESRDKDVYQRLLRLPPPPAFSTSLVGATASAFSRNPEIALFETGITTSGSAAAVRARGRVPLDRDAMDLDVIQGKNETYQLAHCYDHELFLFIVPKATKDRVPSFFPGKSSGPKSVYSIPHDVFSGSPGPSSRPSFRSIRFLTPGFILAVANLPQRRGVVLQGLQLPAKLCEETEKIDDSAGMARLSISRRLPQSVAQATGLAVRNLNPHTTNSMLGNTQFIIAVAGHDASISLFTLDYNTTKAIRLKESSEKTEVLSNLLPFATLNSMHPTHITGLSFSVFLPSAALRSSDSHSLQNKSTPVIKLASVSVGNSVVVHAIPLRKAIEPFQTKNIKNQVDGFSIEDRYIVAIPPNKRQFPGHKLLASIIALFIAFIIQSFLEARGLISTDITGTKRWVPELFDRPFPNLILNHNSHESSHMTGHLQGDLLSRLSADMGNLGINLAASQLQQEMKIILTAEDITRSKRGEAVEEKDEILPGVYWNVEIYNKEVHGPGKEWNQLSISERKAWKEKLKESGYWIEDMGEAALKGVLFGKKGGMVGKIMTIEAAI